MPKLAMAGGALGMMFSQKMASAGVPASVVSSTIKVASNFAAGQAVATAVVSTRVAALTEGVLKSMLLSKLRVAVVLMLAIGALGITAGALAQRTGPGEPRPPVSKSAAPGPDEGKLTKTVLALEKRIWKAHTKQDIDVFKSLLADDFTGTDIRGDSYTKEDALNYVATYRVVDPVLTNARVVVLNATSAIVTYEIHYKVVSTDGQQVDTVSPRQATTAWAMRDGKWRYVYCEANPLR
jgi:hypothetical protein